LPPLLRPGCDAGSIGLNRVRQARRSRRSSIRSLCRNRESIIANFIVLVGPIGIGILMLFARPLAGLVVPGIVDPGDADTLVRGKMEKALPYKRFLTASDDLW
jgi:hypothetical protein